MTRVQCLPQSVEALRPTSRLAPLHERSRSRQRPWLLAQHVEIVLQVEDLLLTAVAAFMPCQAHAFMPQLNVISTHFGFYDRAWRQRNGVAVRSDAHATQAIHRRKTGWPALRARQNEPL